jgi:hypothetical protein
VLANDRRAIGGDGVDAQPSEAEGDLRIIDGPHVELETARSNLVDEVLVDMVGGLAIQAIGADSAERLQHLVDGGLHDTGIAVFFEAR